MSHRRVNLPPLLSELRDRPRSPAIPVRIPRRRPEPLYLPEVNIELPTIQFENSPDIYQTTMSREGIRLPAHERKRIHALAHSRPKRAYHRKALMNIVNPEDYFSPSQCKRVRKACGIGIQAKMSKINRRLNREAQALHKHGDEKDTFKRQALIYMRDNGEITPYEYEYQIKKIRQGLRHVNEFLQNQYRG